MIIVLFFDSHKSRDFKKHKNTIIIIILLLHYFALRCKMPKGYKKTKLKRMVEWLEFRRDVEDDKRLMYE